ncbi:hypothetical protein V2G26_020329 [Clonostachys chloroleuca]
MGSICEFRFLLRFLLYPVLRIVPSFMPSSLSATSDPPNMSHLSASQSQVEMEDQPIVRPFRASALLPTRLLPTQHHPPSFPGTGQTLDAEDRAVPKESRMADADRAHFQAGVNMDGSDSHMPLPPAAPSTPPVISAEEHMKFSVLLGRKTKERTWPLLPVACERWPKEEYDSSFKKVVEYLKDAVDCHETLRDNARNILYRLMMVGLSLESAKPSVLILCDYTNRDSLKSLFKNMPSQYNCIIPSAWRSTDLSTMSKSKPILWLYLCLTNSKPFKRLNGVPVDIECTSLVTMCGSLVQFEDRRSTISLTLDIDGEDRLLTVEHIFRDKEPENDKPKMSPDPESLASIESNIEQSDRLDDSQDDISTDLDTDSNHDDPQMDRDLPTAPVDCNSSQVSHKPKRPSVEAPARLPRAHKQGERVEPPNTLRRRSPYLDWACLRLVNYQMAPRQRCNFLLRPGKPPSLLEDVASKPRTHAVPVFMVSGILGVRSGRLIDSPSYLGPPKGQDLCETWTIILDKQEAFCPGESGSIVVDQETLSIYGHLVGSDTFGYGHVVPFSRTIEQIRTAFNVDNAGLPTLENSGSHQEVDRYSKDDRELAFLLLDERPDMSKVQQLIERGANVNRRVGLGGTPVYNAASRGHLAFVKLLLENGADLSVPNISGETPVWKAARRGYLDVVKLLLENGADLSVSNTFGETPVCNAASGGHLAVVKLLLSLGSEVNCKDKHNRTPLREAIRKGHHDIVEALIEAGAEVNAGDIDGCTPLSVAARIRRSDIVRQLLKAGAEVNARDKNGTTPLLYAAQHGYSDITQQLIEAGAEVDVRDKDGHTPLLIATRHGYSDIIRQLMKASALLDSKDDQGQTALFIAVQRREYGIIRMLIEGGAATDVEDNRGRTLLTLANKLKVDLFMHLAEAKDSVDEREG